MDNELFTKLLTQHKVDELHSVIYVQCTGCGKYVPYQPINGAWKHRNSCKLKGKRYKLHAWEEGL